jgi:predicted MFS family arabinose efflux permease
MSTARGVDTAAAARIGVAYSLLTLSDGALRMLVLFHYYQLGYNALDLALVFVIYEACGVVVNLVGGHLAQRLGLLTTMRLGLALQCLTLVGLGIPAYTAPLWAVMLWQGSAGIAKDLTKISAKSAIATLSRQAGQGGLFGAISLLTGAKNTLKGIGFFAGGALLIVLGAQSAFFVLAALIVIGLLLTLGIHGDIGSSKIKRFGALFANNAAVNRLSFARIFLFGARDVWLAIALPLYLAQAPGWGFWQAGAVMAAYTIGYGVIQANTPRLLSGRRPPDGVLTALLALMPAAVCLMTAIGHWWWPQSVWLILGGVFSFSVVFALNSALHSYLITAYATAEQLSLNIGFYYSANALGRLLGTVASGLGYLAYGMPGVVIGAGLALLPAAIAAWPLPRPAGMIVANADAAD